MGDKNKYDDISMEDLLKDLNSLDDLNDNDENQIKVYPISNKSNSNASKFDTNKLNQNISTLINTQNNKSKNNKMEFEDCPSFSSYEEINNNDKPSNKEQELPNNSNKKKYNRRKFTIFGRESEKNLDLELIKKRGSSLIDDYKKIGDIPYIKTELNKKFQSYFIKTILTAFLALMVLVPTVLTRLDIISPNLILGEYFSVAFSSFCLLNLILAVAISYKDLFLGLVSLIKLKGNCDSAVAFSCLCASIQLISALIFPNEFVLNGKLPIYTCIAVMGLFFNVVGKLFIAVRVRKNFSFVCSSSQKYAVKTCTDVQQARRVSRSAYNQKVNVCYQQKTDFLSDFLKISYAPDPSDYLAYSTAVFGAGLSILVAITAGIIKLDILYAITALALSSCVCIPMSTILAVNMQLWSLCKETLKKGCMISGFWSVRHFSDINSIVVDASNLYPKGSIVLKGIKTFNSNSIDKSLLSAAAMLIEADSPLKYIFDEIIQGRKNILPIVDNVEYIDGKGIVGWSNDDRMLIGNRKLLEEFMISTPTLDFENKYKSKGYDVTYFACSGKVFAAFILKYNPNSKIMREIQRLEYDGINVLVRTVDPNLTVERIADNFDVYFKTIKILPIDTAIDFKDYLVNSENKSKAYIASTGRIDSVIRAISGCNRIKSNLSLSMAIQIIAMIIGFALTSLLIFYSKLEQVGCLELIIFVLFWIAAVLIPPRIKKP